MLADYDSGIGVVEQRHAGEEMESRGGQGILIGPPVDLGPHQLFWRGVGDGPDRHGGRGQTGGVIEAPGDPEVGKQCAWLSRVEVRQQDVGGLHVAVQHEFLVRVVEGAGDLADQPHHVVRWHPVAISVLQQLPGVGAVDEVHRYPQLTVEFPAVVDPNDVGVEQPGHHVGFPLEPLTIFAVGTDVPAEDLDGFVAGQSGMLGEVHLAHSARSELPHDGVPREGLTWRQRHASSSYAPLRVDREYPILILARAPSKGSGSGLYASQPLGSPSTRCAMMFRWISDVPPAMVPAKDRM